MKRPAQPEEIAPADVFLAANQCSGPTTGETLPDWRPAVGTPNKLTVWPSGLGTQTALSEFNLSDCYGVRDERHHLSHRPHSCDHGHPLVPGAALI
jgi:hypothetical protein